MKTRFTHGPTVLPVMSFFLLCTLTITFGQCEPEFIDQGLNLPSTLRSADVDGDGDQDLISCEWGESKIYWYENSYPDWTRHEIDADSSGVGTAFADVDGDEKPDLVVAGFSTNTVMWYRNMGGSPPQWEMKLIDGSLNHPEWVAAADLDNDEDTDVIATGYDEDSLLWYENGGDGLTWTRHAVAGLDGPILCSAMDVDGDDTMDIVVNTAVDWKNFLWYKNGHKGQQWTEHVIKSGISGYGSFSAADCEGDGDPDLVITFQNQNLVLLLLNQGNDPVEWTEVIIDNENSGAFCPIFTDLDNDGMMDIVASANVSGELFWYRNTGTWGATEKYIIDENISGTWDVIAMDADQDDLPDLVNNQWTAAASLRLYTNPAENAVLYDPVHVPVNGAVSPVSVFPNPFGDLLTVKCERPGGMEVTLFSLTGQEVFSATITRQEETLDLGRLPAGIYLFRAIMDGKEFSCKVVRE